MHPKLLIRVEIKLYLTASLGLHLVAATEHSYMLLLKMITKMSFGELQLVWLDDLLYIDM